MSTYKVLYNNFEWFTITSEEYKTLIMNKQLFRMGDFAGLSCSLSLKLENCLKIFEVKERLVWEKEKLPEDTIKVN